MLRTEKFTAEKISLGKRSYRRRRRKSTIELRRGKRRRRMRSTVEVRRGKRRRRRRSTIEL